MVEKKEVFRIKMDGAMLYEEYDSVETAMEAAEVYFHKDTRNRRAEIIRYTVNPVGLIMRNREKMIV